MEESNCLGNNLTMLRSVKIKKKALRGLITLALVFYVLYLPFECLNFVTGLVTTN